MRSQGSSPHTASPPPTRRTPLRNRTDLKPKMRGASGALCVAVAALLVCCNADSPQDSEVNDAEHTGERFDNSGQKPRNLDPIGGGNLVRQVRDSGHGFIPYLIARQHYSGAGGRHELWPMSSSKYTGYYGDGYPKRNFDEIDLSGLNNFVRKRNIDEIDQTAMPFPYSKRYYRPVGPNHSYLSSFDKKRYRADYPMDEIDLSHFPIGSKRSQNSWPLR